MFVIDAIVILVIASGLFTLITQLVRGRSRRVELREARDFQLRQLVAAKEVVSLLMLDEDNAAKVFLQLEKELRAKGKLPEHGT